MKKQAEKFFVNTDKLKLDIWQLLRIRMNPRKTVSTKLQQTNLILDDMQLEFNWRK
ncbi:hypothetical protein ACUNWD_15720 [Sunxiuqinia sp. A32]|uniref:hypothetical protein n=1 Tax=Sunxiuqinia sp. A32 TaxID=3461496 RepID=UPI00404538D7